MSNLIEIKNLTKNYGKFTAVKDISLELEAGKIYTVMGPNGAGKSTFTKVVAGIMKPTSGTVKIFGIDPRNLPRDKQRRLGYMPQELGLYENLTLRTNLNFFADLSGVSNKQEVIAELQSLLKIEEYMDKKVSQLSGGSKKKASLAVALVNKPQVLFLDEPTVGIDPDLRRAIWDYLAEYVKEGNLILLTTHHFEESNYADRILLMKDGEIIRNVAREDIDKPIEEFFYSSIIEE